MNESINTADDRKILRKERIKSQINHGLFKQHKNIVYAIIGSIIFGFIYSFTLTAGYHFLNLFLTLIVGLIILDVLIIRSKEYDLKNLIFWNIIIIAFTSIFYRTTIEYYTIMASLAYPTLFVSLILFSTKQNHLSGKRFILQHVSFLAHLGYLFKAFSVIPVINENKSKTLKTGLHVLIGIAIAVLALLIIIPIMGSADMFFKESLSSLYDYINDIEIGEFTWKLILGVFLTLCSFGFIYTGMVKKYKYTAIHNKIQISPIMIITVLSIIGLAYLVFISTQINHLFITKPTDGLEGFSFSKYARSGFFEMVWLSTINIIIILICLLFQDQSQQFDKVLKGLMMYFNFINLYMLAVSFYKMFLYQSEFGFTEKRILVYIYIVYQLIVLALLAIRIFNHDFKFWTTLLYTSCIFWAAISFINIQNLSFELNVERYKKTGEIDTDYLSGYTTKAASRAVKNFYFECFDNLDELDQKHHENIINYFGADSKYGAGENTISEDDNKHGLFEINIQNSIYERDAEIVLRDFEDIFIKQVEEQCGY